MKEWRKLPWAECPLCGSEAESLTDPRDFRDGASPSDVLPEGWVGDGDEVRCSECGHPGSASTDGEHDDARVHWHDDPDYDCCDWCRARKPKEKPQ